MQMIDRCVSHDKKYTVMQVKHVQDEQSTNVKFKKKQMVITHTT